jgi:hypothetical protein
VPLMPFRSTDLKSISKNTSDAAKVKQVQVLPVCGSAVVAVEVPFLDQQLKKQLNVQRSNFYLLGNSYFKSS